MRDSHWPHIFPLLRWLGYGGLVPFATLALGSWLHPDPGFKSACLALLLAYGLAIITFVGALWWGIALTATDLERSLRKRLLLWSVIPSLAGWAAFTLPAAAAFLLLAAIAAASFAVDFRWAPRMGLPRDWVRLRLHLSVGAIASLAIGAHAAATLGG